MAFDQRAAGGAARDVLAAAAAEPLIGADIPGPATGGPLIRDRAPSSSAAHAGPSGRIAYLDGWRGLSILLVVVGHFLPQKMVGIADEGVELFFVLSGRLMAEILFVDAAPLAKFYRRRISRIYPAMFAFVLLTFVGMHWTDFAYKPQAVLLALTFTINYGLALVHGVPAIDNLWSLCIEEHAYLLLGLIAFIARRRRIRPALVIAAIGGLSALDGVASTLLLHQDYFHAYWRTDARLASIFFSAAAFLWLRERRPPPWTPLAAAAVAGAFAFTPDWLHYSAGTAALAIAVCSLDRIYAPVLKVLSVPALTALGLWSYSIYLWQQPFYRLHLKGELPLWAAGVLALGVALASYRFVEQPARRWLNAHWGRRGGAWRGFAAPA